MDSKRKVCQVYNDNRQGSQLTGQTKTGGGTVYKQILINAKLQIGEWGQKAELSGRSPLKHEGPHWTVVPSKEKRKFQ